MEEATYRTWWALHLRAARGESLTGEEREQHEAGLRQLHQGEVLREADALRQERAAVKALEEENARLSARREHLEAEIAALEAALSPESIRLAMARP